MSNNKVPNRNRRITPEFMFINGNRRISKIPLLIQISVLLSLFPAMIEANDDPPVVTPLPNMPDGTHVCGTTFILGLIDLEDLESDYHQQLIDPNGDEYEVGDRENFFVVNFEESSTTTEYDEVEFELRAKSDKSEIWVDVDEWEDPIEQEHVDEVLQEQDEQTAEDSWNPDEGIVEVGQELFGDPPDFDDSGRVKTFLVDIQDGWDEDEGGAFIAGYFSPTDQTSLHPNSNEADIIYINTYPGMYRGDQEPNPSRRFGTIAHEYQHLIHYNYNNLNIFQNEGQSEFAELIKGYDARTMHWLDDPEEVDGTVEIDSGPEGLYRWRRGSDDVLMDYQRAQLLHSYIYERTDAELAGAVTRASSDGKDAYREVLDEFDLEWELILRDFQITNRSNNPDIADGRYSYSLPQLTDLRAEGIGNSHSPPLVRLDDSAEDEEVELLYGGGFYSRFDDPEDLEIELSGEEHVKWAAILEGGDTDAEVEILEEGTEGFRGEFDEIILVGSNTREQGTDEENPGSRTYAYSFQYGVATSIVEDGELPQEYKLGNAYPNPFNPATEIQYQVPKEADVRLTVYDVTGQEVAILVSETQQAGEHQATFDAEKLSSGTYIYRIQANDWTASGKMMLIK